MNRFLSLIASLATAFILIGGVSTASFAAPAPAYRLIPVAAESAAATVVAGDILWKSTANGYVAVNATSRPAVACAQAAKKVGKIATFSANGTDFSADELAKCNAKAK